MVPPLSGGYSAEQAGHALSRFADTREKLNHRLEPLAEAIDLDVGARRMTHNKLNRKQLFWLISRGYCPPLTGQANRFADPEVLLVEVARLREEGQRREANQLSQMIRHIRLLRRLAAEMSTSATPASAPA